MNATLIRIEWLGRKTEEKCESPRFIRSEESFPKLSDFKFLVSDYAPWFDHKFTNVHQLFGLGTFVLPFHKKLLIWKKMSLAP